VVSGLDRNRLAMVLTCWGPRQLAVTMPVLMLFEIVVAAASSALLTAERLSAQEMVGGACIILAGALSGLVRRK